MNLLAHIYLSRGNSDLMVGNFIGDAVKGKQYLSYSKQIQNGILFHRRIDKYTDTHPLTSACKQYFIKGFGLHSGIVVDILYDHYLAKNWEEYHHQNLKEFTGDTYNYLQKKIWVMPKKMQMMLPYIIERDWLSLYANIEGIHRVLYGMSIRTSVPAKANYAKAVIEAHYYELEANFKEFFKDLQENITF